MHLFGGFTIYSSDKEWPAELGQFYFSSFIILTVANI